MKIFARILLGIFLTLAVGFSFLLLWVVRDLEPQYRKVTEEPLADAAYTLAALASATVTNGAIDTDLFERTFRETKRPFSAPIYDFIKRDVDLHVYITDSQGTVLFDSRDGHAKGSDYSRWNDVYRALRGRYGSRTSRIRADDPSSSVMYVASPVLWKGRTVGVLSVGKPTRASDRFVYASKRRILIGGIAVFLVVVLTSAVVSGMVTRPLKRLTNYALAVKTGKPAELPRLGTSEIRELGIAFDEMRDALEGKQYVEHYVQTLTHEIKSPLSAIQGAAELLGEEQMDQRRRARFLENIRTEAQRIRILVDKLLLLSSLESRKTRAETEALDMRMLVSSVLTGMGPRLELRKIGISQSYAGETLFQGEEFLVRQALENILQNAIEFTPAHGSIRLETSARDGRLEIAVHDSGPGIPSYASDKIFERFYSLKRPDTGRKSSGLGLSLVLQIMTLHNGYVRVENRPAGGTCATLGFPA